MAKVFLNYPADRVDKSLCVSPPFGNEIIFFSSTVFVSGGVLIFPGFVFNAEWHRKAPHFAPVNSYIIYLSRFSRVPNKSSSRDEIAFLVRQLQINQGGEFMKELTLLIGGGD